MITMVVWMNYAWEDQGLMWNTSAYGGIKARKKRYLSKLIIKHGLFISKLFQFEKIIKS